MSQKADVIVVGLGAMGSAAVYQLAKQGLKVIGIDQFAPPHSSGSSGGETRIFRQVTRQGDEYTPLALRAQEIWRELERETGKDLLTTTGCIFVDGNKKLSNQNPSDYLALLEKTAKQDNIAHEMLGPEELMRRFPEFAFRGNEQGFYENGAGFLRPEACIDAQLSLAKKLGAQINLKERVLKYVPTKEGGVTLQTDKGDYTADKLVVTAGPWISNFFPEQRPLFNVCREVLYWFDVPGTIEPYQPDKFPVFIFKMDDGDWFYGFPAVNGAKGGLKLAGENHKIFTTAEQVDRTVSKQETDAIYESFVRKHLPGLSNVALKSSVCMYTVTPDGNFIIDTMPGLPQIVMASPCDGRGFKYASAIGETLAELASGKTPSINIDAFRLGRFGNLSPTVPAAMKIDVSLPPIPRT